MIRTLIILSPLALAASACSQGANEEAEPQAPTAREVQAAIEKGGKLSPPDRDVFAEKFAAACPSQKPVNKATCLAQGMGSHDFTCEYGLGDDDYLRHEGVLSEVDGEYVLLEPETVCAQGA
ncbi:MAG: hypothetical protein QNI87_09675 [Erythrobacter sp.]|uniref:hypothetical protein n=1 Tax=Erythrobacter sp. TaxID=1042 RepID=UPI00261E7FC0|nr:hypothetical protein [Erythrobacter sp.]MDJ0978795.1 hypothetical protein [Erythrobacter sp.]